MRGRGRVDAAQAEIVAALRQVGASVESLAPLGGGVPDLLVGFHGRAWLLEVKGPFGRLTPAQERWHGDWRGPVAIVRSVTEALAVVLR